MRKLHQVAMGRAKVLGTVLAVTVFVAACGGDEEESAANTVPIAARVDVAGGIDTPRQIVAEIYAQALENAGVRVGRKAPIATRAEALADLEANTVQVYPDFLYSLLTEVSSADGGAGAGDGTTDAQMTSVNDVLPDTISVGDPSTADNGQVVACSAAAVEEFSLTSLDDLFAQAAEITLGGPAEFETASPFGLAGFAADDVEFAEFVALGEDEIGPAIGDRTVDCGVLTGLSSSIVDQALLVLKDESSLAPEDVLVPLVATPALTPDVATIIAQVDQLLTTEILRSLVVKVEIGGESVEQVARAFIASQASPEQ